jgi:hypothetical protein
VWVESTLGRFQPAPNTVVVLAESGTDDEDKALDPIHLRYIMRGAPYLSGPELSMELTAGTLADNSANSAVVQGQIKGLPSQIKDLQEKARQSFASLPPNGSSSSRSQSLRQAVQHGALNFARQWELVVQCPSCPSTVESYESNSCRVEIQLVPSHAVMA